MFQSHIGEMAALMTAVCWSFTSLSFEAAGKRVGSLPVNVIRLVLGFIFLSVFTFFVRGMILPFDASAHVWIWLSLSGLVGFVIGDLFLFEAFVTAGARISMLMMSFVPPITALIGWIMLGETLTWFEILAMAMTVCGVALVVLERNADNRVTFSRPIKGILYAFGGAVGQAVGLILSKYGMGDYNAFAATQIRIITGIAGFLLIFILFKRTKTLIPAVRNATAMKLTALGAFFGPFLGVSLSLFSVQHTQAGIASTIMALPPILIIPLAILLFREKVTEREFLGALIAVVGTALFFI
ncbi:MAG: EamA family transporter [Candidatus Marinimicrobia bacterium CG08_land_8_20_14_0_20_45_22]|nr:MAG: EamA family transporter [Candidatus Marinimicrobia bacterium CG08_land_8_20_14_0_20_45_22]